ncbi:DUF6061 family protein [Paenibacillus lentus]|uniref:DUF6061 family protein n=1 Tax=Paenibacillus lentus TaxID=1338368 RepID=UPI003CCC6232
MQLRACHYDDNSDILTVVDSDGIIYRYHCYEIENSMEMHTAARSRLRWLKEIEPYAFAELVFQRDMRQFA